MKWGLLCSGILLGASIGYWYQRYNDTRYIREARKHYIKVPMTTINGFKDQVIDMKFILEINGKDHVVVKHKNGHYYASEVKQNV